METTLNYLTIFLNERITIKLKTGEILTGCLEAVDEHINVLLSGCPSEAEDKSIFIRGENIFFIGQPTNKSK